MGKRSQLLSKAVTIALMALAAAGMRPGFGAPSGLNIIPTGEVLGKNEYSLAYEKCWQPGQFGSVPVCGILTQFGLGPRLEGGVDFDLSDESSVDAVLNLKWVLLGETREKPAIAVGAFDAASGTSVSYYLVATRHVQDTHLHLGALFGAGAEEMFAGIARALGRGATFQADWASGSDSCVSAGVSLPLSEAALLTAAYLYPSSSAGAGQWLLNVALGGVLR